MRDLFIRVIVYVVALTVACAGVAASFAFFCFAIFAFLSTLMAPAFAALLTAFVILFVAFLVVAAVIAWARARARYRSDKDLFTTGRVLGAIFARRFRDYAEENPQASLLMSLAAGFFSGVGR